MALLGVIFLTGWYQLPRIGALLILKPLRIEAGIPPPSDAEVLTLQGSNVELKAWRLEAEGDFRGTVIYLHGMADSRGSGAGILEDFSSRGFDAVAYDSRAHGESGGEYCTYGAHEKEDLKRVLDNLKDGPVILLGSSMGAAVALQTAAEDERVSIVIAAESFSDLRTVSEERAPFIFSEKSRERALALAEEMGNFQIDKVSPLTAATKISSPTLIIHGEQDTETPPTHSLKIHEALEGPKKLILVAGAGHSESLSGTVWNEIYDWIDAHLPNVGNAR